MSYYIYENWRAEGHKARIHLSSCPYCNDGEGFHPGASDQNGKWHGPLRTFQSAREAAQDIGARVRQCRHCSPS